MDRGSRHRPQGQGQEIKLQKSKKGPFRSAERCAWTESEGTLYILKTQ